MTQEHPITPPPELVEQWLEGTRIQDCIGAYPPDYEFDIATQAARWGADQELEACCEWVEDYAHCGYSLRTARRPQPPSLKKQALLAIDTAVADERLSAVVADVVRRALEQLDD
jgi:hypothetical protein